MLLSCTGPNFMTDPNRAFPLGSTMLSVGGADHLQHSF